MSPLVSPTLGFGVYDAGGQFRAGVLDEGLRGKLEHPRPAGGAAGFIPEVINRLDKIVTGERLFPGPQFLRLTIVQEYWPRRRSMD